VKEYLKNLKLLDHLTTEIIIQKDDFVSKFRGHVDDGSTGMFSGSFDMVSSSKNEYRGHVGPEGFKIKRKKRLFDVNGNIAIASGSYRQDGEKLIIDMEVNGYTGIMIPFCVFIIGSYLMFIVMFFIGGSLGEGIPVFTLPFVLLHTALMLGIPYFMMRSSVRELKHDLEREFFYMTKK